MKILKSLLGTALLYLCIFTVLFLLFYPGESIFDPVDKEYVIKCIVWSTGVGATFLAAPSLLIGRAVIPECLLIVLFIVLSQFYFWGDPNYLLPCFLLILLLVWIAIERL